MKRKLSAQEMAALKKQLEEYQEISRELESLRRRMFVLHNRAQQLMDKQKRKTILQRIISL